ncbi:MAG: hypothetical protein COB23_04855 [Methylophaga sp.]|nr:MAG: hypothetical protein COB23_04855 [Methylophaga sp.]
MKQKLKHVVIALSIAYPFMVYWGLQYFNSGLLLLLLLLLVGRWIVGGELAERKIIIATIIGLLIIIIIWGHQLSLKFYPVMMNFGFLVLFAQSLYAPTTIIERFARLQEPELSPKLIVYTRKVTWVWSAFFLINGSIAAATALWGSDEIWILYNGLLAYLLIGGLMAGEWLVRQHVKYR